MVVQKGELQLAILGDQELYMRIDLMKDLAAIGAGLGMVMSVTVVVGVAMLVIVRMTMSAVMDQLSGEVGRGERSECEDGGDAQEKIGFHYFASVR